MTLKPRHWHTPLKRHTVPREQHIRLYFPDCVCRTTHLGFNVLSKCMAQQLGDVLSVTLPRSTVGMYNASTATSL